MNINFCRYHCGKAFHPEEIIHVAKDDSWYLFMSDGGNHPLHDGCGCIRIDDASALLKPLPDGWYKTGDNIYRFECGNAEDFMWKIRMKPNCESLCPYLAEHTMYDLNHERKLSEWHEREGKRRELIKERMEKYEERKNAEREELP